MSLLNGIGLKELFLMVTQNKQEEATKLTKECLSIIEKCKSTLFESYWLLAQKIERLEKVLKDE